MKKKTEPRLRRDFFIFTKKIEIQGRVFLYKAVIIVISMKMIKNLFAVLIAAFVVISCQDDSVKETTEALDSDSQLTAVLRAMSVNETSADNVLDGSSCFKVKLPVQVVVNGYQMTINSESDYADVQALLDANNEYEDTIVFTFPIKLETPGYTEIIVKNQARFDALKTECQEVTFNYISDRCTKLVFPVTVYDYNSGFQMQGTNVVNNNKDLYTAIKSFGPNEYFSIGYPVSLKLSEGTVITVNNNNELLAAINSSIVNCQ